MPSQGSKRTSTKKPTEVTPTRNGVPSEAKPIGITMKNGHLVMAFDNGKVYEYNDMSDQWFFLTDGTEAFKGVKSE